MRFPMLNLILCSMKCAALKNNYVDWVEYICRDSISDWEFCVVVFKRCSYECSKKNSQSIHLIVKWKYLRLMHLVPFRVFTQRFLGKKGKIVFLHFVIDRMELYHADNKIAPTTTTKNFCTQRAVSRKTERVCVLIMNATNNLKAHSKPLKCGSTLFSFFTVFALHWDVKICASRAKKILLN